VQDRDMPIGDAQWMIQREPIPDTAEDPLARVGPFVLRRAPFSIYTLSAISGAYGTEVEEKVSRNWVKDTVEYRFHLIGTATKAKLRFRHLIAGDARNLDITVAEAGGTALAHYRVALSQGWIDYESPPFDTRSQDLVVTMHADGDPVHLNGPDSREAKFLVQNLAVTSIAAELPAARH